jgi:hypothetical protein
MELVAFSGYARTGKDEAARALVDIGFVRVAFADKLRDFLYALNPIVMGFGTVENRRLQDIIDAHGWDGYKETIYVKEIRPLLQRLGTECGRGILGENTWVNAALNNLDPDGKYVVTDARFVNEADAIRAAGGKIFRISRPGIGPANDHPSETSLDDYYFDGHVINDGSLGDFYSKVRSLV